MLIYKYSVGVTGDIQTIPIPAMWKVLCVKNQLDNIVLYVGGDIPQEDVYKNIEVIVLPTGGHDTKLEYGFRYLDTVMVRNGVLAWHIFVKE